MNKWFLRRIFGAGILYTAMTSGACVCLAQEVISLAGEWGFAVATSTSSGTAMFKAPLPERVTLPGTTQTNQKGAPFRLSEAQQKEVDAGQMPDSRNPLMNVWTPTYFNAPSAWYQREVNIPAAWAGKRIVLTLERTKITQVWVDEKECGTRDDICTAQEYDLSDALTPGKHRVTIQVRNGAFPRGIGGHHLGGMQGNWNGIVGRIELAATEKTCIENVRVYPDAARKTARVRVSLLNPAGGTLSVSAKAWNTDTPHETPAMQVPVAGAETEFELALGPGARLWDEFHPALYKLSVTLGGQVYATDFGLRDFKRAGTVFTINGNTTFLRGTHDGGHFPLTAYPPMDVEGWLKIMRACREHGINHFRFHTWTPPEAAFAAADMLGFYMQPELPSGAGFPYGEVKEHDEYCKRVGGEMLRKWGNHPSFVMLALGNEISIKKPENRPAMTELVSYFRALDSTKLYAEGSNNDFGKPTLNPNDDYWTTMRIPDAKKQYIPIRASFSGGNGWLNVDPPSTRHDYVKERDLAPVPLIGHEVGQFTVFPDLAERKKYTGVYKLRNYDLIEKRMRAGGVAGRDAEYYRASGALAVLCYKEEIEAYLRTPGFGGFQLLDLADNQEQGTSLVGILNSFYDSKNLISPAEWREFCCETVPMARFEKYVWTADESFTADAMVAHYGPQTLQGIAPKWKMTDASGAMVAEGALATADLVPGGVRPLGWIKASLNSVKTPARLTLEIALPGTPYKNHYPLWVYPKMADTAAPAGVTVARTLNEALGALEKGGRVLLFPRMKDIEKCSVRTGFETVFWNFCFANQPPTMGILCDPKHPALSLFPTETHSNWQWFNLVTKMRAMVLSDLPADYRPVVEVMDNIATCRKLGLVWEARVGSGNLLVCTAELPALQDKPEARQLMASLMRHAGSAEWKPALALSAAQLTAVFEKQSVAGPAKARRDE